MNRYLLFVFPAGQSMYDHQPKGGWDDLVGDFESVEACQVAAHAMPLENEDEEEYSAHIVDLEIRMIVLRGEAGPDYLAGWNWKR